MATTITQISNSVTNSVRTTVWQLSGNPAIGQRVNWGVYSYNLQSPLTTANDTIDTVGAYIENQTNATSVSSWKSANPASYGSFVQGNPVGFKPFADYNSITNRLTITLNSGNQFAMGITAPPTATPLPTATNTPAPTNTPVPTGQPTQGPVGTTVLHISASNIGNQPPTGTLTLWAEACGDEGIDVGTPIYTAIGDQWNNLYNIPAPVTTITLGQLSTGVGISVPLGTQQVWIQSSNPNCPDCYGPYSTGLDIITPTPTPAPTATPAPTRTPLPTGTPAPTPTPGTYKVVTCNTVGTGNEQYYYIPADSYCLGGNNIQYTAADNWGAINNNSVVQIQLPFGNSAPEDCVSTSGTFCVQVVGISNVPADAIRSRKDTVSQNPTGCDNASYCQN